MNYLFTRTDRVGDLLVSSIILKSIKRSNNKNKIYIICSEYNSDLAKNLSFIDVVFILKKGFINKLKLIFKINLLKIDYMLIVDGKDRSILLSYFILAKKKIYALNKKKFSFFLKFNKRNLIYDDEKKDTKINIIKKIQNKIKINFSEKDTNILEKEFFSDKLNNKDLNSLDGINYNLLHYDEKWIKKLYIESYKSIELKYIELKNFAEGIINRSKTNLVISSGKFSTESLDTLKLSMEHVGNKVYKKKINNFFLYYVERPNFYELIDLIRKSKLCITCHGSATHISSSFNNKTIDIIDGSKISLYRAYTSHLKNYNEIIREDSKTTTEKIFNLL